MKTYLTITLLLIGMMGWGQEAKLDNWREYWHLGNVNLNTVEYTYDSLDKLKKVYYNRWMAIPKTATYSNDTLIWVGDMISSHSFYYFDNDTVLMTFQGMEGPDTNFLHISENNEVLNTGYSYSGYLNWENGNCMSAIYETSGDTVWYREYYSEYINPWYEENKYLRWSTGVGTHSGSYNLWSNHYHGNQHYEFDVVQSNGPFPTIIDYYHNGNLYSTFYFEYKYVIVDTPEIPDKPATVLSIDYFDMLGRKIPKPNEGFYIERKTTDKGIISTKHYIR